MGKIISKDDYKNGIKPGLVKNNNKVALCHGVFDLVHPGHIIHFQQARQMADILVVSITAAKYVRKGPGRPYFSDEMRLQFLSAIECIDYVMLSDGYTVDDIIEAVEPNFYVKGSEYRNASDDITGKISTEEDLVKRHGGKLVFTDGAVFSSTKLINNALSAIPEDVRAYIEEVKKRTTMKGIREYADKAGNLKILVIGDIIIDKYTYCTVQGVMSKDSAYSTRLENSEEYLGGAAAVARHLATFSPHVKLLSVVGNEADINDRITSALSPSMQLELVHSHERPTIIKHRYLSRNEKRGEQRKLFSINNIPERAIYESSVREEFLSICQALVSKADVVFLCDFGHGLADKTIMDYIQEKAKYLVLNCQTNSSNRGQNIITKYKRADMFTLDQAELKLAYPMGDGSEKEKLEMLSKKLGGCGFLTRGAYGAYGIYDGSFSDCPALTLTVKDTIGAGDAFLAVAGIYSAVGASIKLTTLMGNIGGALGANIIGNKDAVEKVNVLKFASTLMNI